jgi:hypothetical protein
MDKGSRFSCCFRVLMVVCLFGCVLALPAGALFPPSKVILVTPDLCAGQEPVADFSYSVVSLNPLEILLNDKSTCANQWQWKVYNNLAGGAYFGYTSLIMGPKDKNIVVTLPSPGVYTVMLRTGRDCQGFTADGCPEGGTMNLMNCCESNNLGDYTTQDVNVTASPTTTPATPVTTQATQPPQSLPATISPTAPLIRLTLQQSATVVLSQTTAPAATTFAPAPAGPGSGAISITTSPPGAEVWIDNEMKGASPAVISALSPGTHALALRKTGYQNISTTFIIESGQTREYSTGLIPANKSPGFSALLALGGIFVLFFARKIFR